MALRPGIAAKLQQKETAAVWEKREVIELQMFLSQIGDETAVERFQPDRPKFGHFRNVIRRVENIRIAEDQKRARRRAMDEADRRCKHHHTGAFGADERARHVKSFFRQQLVKVVAGNAPWNSWIARANKRSIMIAQLSEPRINFAAPPAS